MTAEEELQQAISALAAARDEVFAANVRLRDAKSRLRKEHHSRFYHEIQELGLAKSWGIYGFLEKEILNFVEPRLIKRIADECVLVIFLDENARQDCKYSFVYHIYCGPHLNKHETGKCLTLESAIIACELKFLQLVLYEQKACQCSKSKQEQFDLSAILGGN